VVVDERSGVLGHDPFGGEPRSKHREEREQITTGLDSRVWDSTGWHSSPPRTIESAIRPEPFNDPESYPCIPNTDEYVPPGRPLIKTPPTPITDGIGLGVLGL
jgi:hypothetical protein